MTSMEDFFETMKQTAKYAVIATSLSSMLVTGMPGLAQAGQPDLAGKSPAEIVQMEVNVLGDWDSGKTNFGLNVLGGTQQELRDQFVKLQYAHNRLQPIIGEKVDLARVLGADYSPAAETDLSAVKDFVNFAKEKAGTDFSKVEENFKQQIDLMTRMEDVLTKLADGYNGRTPVGSEGWTTKYDNDDVINGYNTQYEELVAAVMTVREDPAVSFLVGKNDLNGQARSLPRGLEEVAEVDQALLRAKGDIAGSIRRLAKELPPLVHELPTKAEMDKIREAVDGIEVSGFDVQGIHKNLEARHDLLKRLETNFQSVVKDYYSNDTESLSKGIALVELDILQHDELMRDEALLSLRPEPAVHRSAPSARHGGSRSNGPSLWSATRVGLATSTLRR